MKTTAYGIPVILVGLSFVPASPRPADAQLLTTTHWINDSGGSFTASGNWSDGVPGATDTAVFRRGNVAPYTVTFASPIPFPIGSAIHPTINRLIIGTNTVNFLSLAPSTLTVDDFAMVGGGTTIGQTASDVAVLNMNLASLSTLSARLGDAAGSSGTLNVNGGTRSFNVNGIGGDLIVGVGGSGAVNVTGGADVTVADDTILGQDATGTGNVSVSGNGSLWTNTGDVVVGNHGTGTLSIANSGAMNVMGQLDIGAFDVGVMTVDGGTSTITGFFHIGGSNMSGADGDGTLNIRNGGSVTSLNFSDIGRSSNSTGLVRVDSGSTWNTGFLTVGEIGDGTLEVTGGATVSSNFASDLGRVAGSTGTAVVEGNNSSWTVTGELDVGRAGSGTLQISAGGRVEINGAAGTATYIGRFGTAAGEVILSSGRWDNSRNLHIGHEGNGTLNITQGIVTNLAGFLGGQPGGTGAATVDGTGSMWINEGEFRVGDAGSGMLHISDGGNVTVAGGASAHSYVGHSSMGQVVVDSGGRWNNSHDLYVGFLGTGTLSIEGGEVTSGLSVIGHGMDSVGTATVAGGDSTWHAGAFLSVGSLGQGTLIIQDGGTVLNANGSIGDGTHDDFISTATVTGTDGSGSPSTWNNSGEVRVGSAGEGRLNIQGGGVVLSADGFIGAMAGSVGTASVTGSDGSGNASTWTNTGNLRIGYQGSGTLAIEEGGSVSTEFGFIGQEQDSTGTVTVSGADSSWTNATLNIGGGGTGTLHILDGGQVIDDAGKVINGEVIVSGADLAGNPSKWTNGELAVGANDDLTGELLIQNGGSVSATFANIGSDAGSIGMANVIGADSTWTNVMFLRVGDSGTGTLTIEEGGSVTSDGDGYLGNMMDSEGTATVTGAGSTWTIAEELRVGNMGSGTLVIQAGGSVDNENGAIGYNSGSDGTVTVTGPNAMWTNHSSLRVANSGAGTLSIESGGSVGSPDGSIAAEANSTGMVNVSGDGSAWNISGHLAVGGNAATATSGGTGTLRIQPGGAVNVADDILLFSDGRVDLEGGTLSAATIDRSGGEFDWTGGTLHVELFNGNLINQGGTLAPGHTAGSTTVVGDYTQQAGAALEIEIGGTLVAAEHDFVNVTDTALLGGELHVALIDGFVPDPLDTFTVFNADALLGFFSNVTNGQRLETLDGTGSFLAHYGPTSAFAPNQIVLTDFDLSDLMGIPGDYNGNGLVEQADLDLVLGNWGADAAVPPANWINDFPGGFIDQDELDRVLSNWGQSTGLVGAATAVPEPSSIFLAIGVMLLAVHSARRAA